MERRLNIRFDSYLSDLNKAKVDGMLAKISRAIVDNNEKDLEAYALSAVMEGVYFEILNKDGTMVFSTGNLNGPGMMGQGVSILKMQNMPMYQGFNVFSSILSQGEIDLLINIGLPANDQLSGDGRKFISTIYGSIGITLVLVLMIAFFLSRYLAKPINRDILAIKKTADAITNGDFSVKEIKTSSVLEVEALRTAVHQMATTLSQQESIRRDLIETVNHEVKTPLTILKTQIDSFLDGINEANEENLMKCRDEITRLESLMTKMDTSQAVQKAKYVIDKTRFNMDDELENIRSILKPQFDKKNQRIIIEGDLLGNIHSDRYKIRQIIYNLLSNANKFADESSLVKITKEFNSTQDTILLHIESKGIVIDLNEHERIFESHYRSEEAIKRDPSGKGLGLSIVRNLAEVLGGQVQLKESSVEKTVFLLRLPMTTHEA